MEKKLLVNICEKDIKIEGRLIRIARPDADLYEPLEDPEAMVVGLQKSGMRIDLLTFMQLMPDAQPKFSYPMEWDNLAVLEISTFDQWWKELRSEARNRARQAEKKGVTVREVPFDDALVRGIQGVYNESPIRQGKPNLHFGKDFETLRREEATFLHRSIFIGAYLDEELIGFVKLTTDQHQTQANLMNITSMVKHRDKAPTNALVAQCVKSCAARGLKYLVYQHYVYGNKKPDSLTNFKAVNGFKPVNLPRYYVPLTPIGRLAHRFGLHRGLINLVPESLLERFRKIRAAWYTRKFQVSGTAS